MSFFNNMVWFPALYENSAVIADMAGQEMLGRLDWMTLKPQVILDLGAGTGEFSALLQKRYPQAMILTLDSSDAMLHYAREKKQIPFCVIADGLHLPLPDDSVDLIFANFFLPWQLNYLSVLKEWKRVLRRDGVLLFTSLGPDTLQECRPILLREHLPSMVDMHDIGDLLLQHFADPVLDVNRYTLSYRESKRLLDELHASGLWFPDEVARQKSLATENKRWDVTFEIIYAHAFL